MLPCSLGHLEPSSEHPHVEEAWSIRKLPVDVDIANDIHMKFFTKKGQQVDSRNLHFWAIFGEEQGEKSYLGAEASLKIYGGGKSILLSSKNMYNASTKRLFQVPSLNPKCTHYHHASA